MSRIHATPDEIERFAGSLTYANTQLRDLTSWLRGQVEHLSQTWDDPKFYQFRDELEQASRTLYRFIDQADDYVGYLNRQAQRGYDFVNSR